MKSVFHRTPNTSLSLGAGIVACALATALPLPALAQTNAAAAVTQFEIGAGPLDRALNEFGRQSGVMLSVDAELTKGKTSPGVSGARSVDAALQQLLLGTGLGVVRAGDGSYSLRRQQAGATVLPTMKIESTASTEGTAEQGYLSNSVSPLGPWSGRTLQDTPYSINVVPKELIENLQASMTDQVFKLNPVTQLSWPQIQNDSPYIFLRGFQTSTFARDGIMRQRWNYAHGTSMEEVERMEVLTGLSGFLYGPGSIGGLVNFVTKRPTAERLNSITLTNTGASNYILHGDFGGRIDDAGQFGYRINAASQDGETHVDDLDIRRDFFSAAFAWNINDDLQLQLDGSKRDYRLDGRQAYWYLAEDARRPSADDIDADKTWGQKWTMHDIDSERLHASMRWNISDNITLRSGALDERNVRTGTTADNTIQSDGTYNQDIWTNRDAAQRIEGSGAYAFADVVFVTGSINHKLTAGIQYSDNVWRNHPDTNTQVIEYTGLSLSAPMYFARPAFPAHGTLPRYEADNQRSRNISIGDDIAFNDKWSALIGLNDSRLYSRSREETGATLSHYDESEVTPTLSLIYKPLATLTTYASYMEGLEAGGTASDSFAGLPVVNANEVMSPLTSKQIEIGAKKQLGGVLLTAALFEIDKPLEYYDVRQTQARFVQDGRQVHRGLELTATGAVTPNLTIVGGASLLDPEIRKNQETPELEGNRPAAVAERMFKLYGEYNVPAIRGLSVNSGVSYTGDFYGDELNTDRIPSYTLLDIGARYVVDAGGVPLTLRLNINNVTDKSYWANQYFLGESRNIIASANISF